MGRTTTIPNRTMQKILHGCGLQPSADDHCWKSVTENNPYVRRWKVLYFPKGINRSIVDPLWLHGLWLYGFRLHLRSIIPLIFLSAVFS